MKYLLHISDIEGNMAKLTNAIKAFNQLHGLDIQVKQDAQGIQYLHLPENVYFVSGGDAVDKGPDDQAVLTLLTRTKIEFPTQCHLIAGNRDYNKMRWLVEVNLTHIDGLLQAELLLDDEAIKRSGGDRDEALTWVDPGMDAFITFLKKVLLTADKQAAYRQFNALADEEKLIHYVKWMLQNTMGAPNAWEYRRQELAKLMQVHEQEITDQQVFAGFMQLYGPEGLIQHYLKNTKMIDIVEGIVFTHGGICDDSFTFMMDGKVVQFDDLAHLQAQVNQRYGTRIQEFYDKQDYTPDAPYRELQNLGISARHKGHSVTAVKSRNDKGVLAVLIEKSLARLGNIAIFIFGHDRFGRHPGMASKYYPQGGKIRAIQMFNNDTDKEGDAQEASFVGVIVQDDGSRHVQRYAQDKYGEVQFNASAPIVDADGFVQADSEDPDLFVGAPLGSIPPDFVPDEVDKALSKKGWIVDSYDSSYRLRLVDRANDVLSKPISRQELRAIIQPGSVANSFRQFQPYNSVEALLSGSGNNLNASLEILHQCLPAVPRMR